MVDINKLNNKRLHKITYDDDTDFDSLHIDLQD